MRVVRIKGGEYPDVLGSYDEYERFDDGADDSVFFYGYNSSRDEKLKERFKGYRHKAYINLEAPCSFFTSADAITSQEYFDKVYTICPYTAKWLNGDGDRYSPIIQPYRESCFDRYKEMMPKKYDVLWQGGLYSQAHYDMIGVMRKYDYVFCSLGRFPGVTHRKVKSRRKWDLIAASKCSVSIDLLYPSKDHIANVKSYKGWMGNDAFINIDDGIVPQSKARSIEAAACKTLNLVMKTPWNVMEYWFDKDEFVYWETLDELDAIIKDVSENFDNYKPIINKAYEKAQEYTTERFFKRVVDNARGDIGIR